MHKNLRVWMEVAIIAAMAMALSFIPDLAGWFSPSFGTIVIVVFALRRGLLPALAAGLLWGLLHFVLAKVYFLSVPQVLIEYILAFASAGFAGLLYPAFQEAFSKKDKSKLLTLTIVAAFVGAFAKYLWHFIAGFIFWGSYAPEGMSPYWYSFTVNGAAGLQTFLIVSVVAILLLNEKRIYQIS